MGDDSADIEPDKGIQVRQTSEWTDEDERKRRAALSVLDAELRRLRDDELRWAEIRRLVDRAGLPRE